MIYIGRGARGLSPTPISIMRSTGVGYITEQLSSSARTRNRVQGLALGERVL